jgi:tetratricopeptide (TPR) repeat protein
MVVPASQSHPAAEVPVRGNARNGQHVAGIQAAPGTPAASPPRPAGPGPVRSGRVPRLADAFRPRADLEQALMTALGPGRTVALTPPRDHAERPGRLLAGTGKTQLAAFAAESLWQSRGIDLLIWVDAAGRDSILTGLAQARADVTGADPGDTAESAAARFVTWLAETGRPWLLVLDDLADAADLEGVWPQGPAGRVLITTGNPAAVDAGHGVRLFPVAAFSPREAMSYMMARLSADTDQRAGVADLIEELACQPLALAQASSRMATSGETCRAYCDEFTGHQAQLLAATGAHPAPAEVTWRLSLQEADRRAPGSIAQPVLALAALLDGHGIPGAVLAGAAAAQQAAPGPADPALVPGVLTSLEQAGLLTIDPENDARTVQMSPAVQAAIRPVIPPPVRDRLAGAAARALLEAWPEGDPDPRLALALRCCTAALRRAAGDPLWADGGYPVLFRAGRSLADARLPGLAAGYWRELAVTSDRLLGSGDAHAMAARAYLADACLAAGRAPEAIALYERIADARTRALGADHPDTLAVRVSLGRALMAAGRAGEATTRLETAAGACERVRGPEHPDTLDAQDGLAGARAAAGRFQEAARLYERTLAVRERLQGTQHPDTMTVRVGLAEAYRQAGRLKDAFPQYKRALADLEAALGPDHLDTIAARGHLAAAYHQARRLKDALPLYERTLADRERVQGPDHADTIGARGNLASACHSAGRMATALDLYDRTRADCERVLGADHPDTLASRANLAHAYHAVGRDRDAIALLRKTAADCERVLPPGDPLTRAVRESLQAAGGG